MTQSMMPFFIIGANWLGCAPLAIRPFNGAAVKNTSDASRGAGGRSHQANPIGDQRRASKTPRANEHSSRKEKPWEPFY